MFLWPDLTQVLAYKTLCSGLTNCTNLSHKICTATCCIPNCSAYDSLDVLLQLYALKAPVIPNAFNMHYASADKSLTRSRPPSI